MAPPSFSEGLDKVLYTMAPGDRPAGTTSFPAGVHAHQATLVVDREESVHAWFRRCVDALLKGEPSQCGVEENIALFLSVRWEARQITYVSAQALVVLEGTLEDFYLEGALKARYLRMDFDPAWALGPMFKEALPHLHVVPDGAPRFHLDAYPDGDIVGAFLDLVYRNHAHEIWIAWARQVWVEEHQRFGFKENAFRVIEEAYNGSQHEVLRERYAEHLRRMKRVFTDRRAKFFPLRASIELCDLLSYEGGRRAQ